MSEKAIMIAGLVAVLTAASAGAEVGALRPYEGLRALVAEPENSWTWDSAVFGALEERGFRVDYGPVPADAASLSSYDMVALNIKRYLTPAESAALEAYVAAGGSVYGSWGGPMASPGFLNKVCKVADTRSLRLKQFVLLDSPLTKGIPDPAIQLAERAGHMSAGAQGWEIVAVQPLEGGIPVAKDPAGNVLGVLNRYGKGRTAVLGFGPDQEKYLAKRELGPVMMDNLLSWLLEDRLGVPGKGWSGRVTIALPARAQVQAVYLNGQRLPDPAVRHIGSLKKVDLDVAGVASGEQAAVRITYAPLTAERNIQTVVHLPWAVLRAAAGSPARLADYLQSLHATTVQPLLRGSSGEAWYKGMPEDQADDLLAKQYRGNFLADLISECHKRGIKVIGGVYFDDATPVRMYPETARLDRQGSAMKDQYGRTLACFNNPKGQQHSLATIRQLLDDYELDGVILDDNFELDQGDCFCAWCKDDFRRYCDAKGIAYADPAQASDGAAWRQYRREATLALAAKVRQIAREHGVPAGGWVGSGMGSTYLSASFDFLGGMVYTEPPRAVRAPLSVLGDCGLICLLWAPGSDPQTMVAEVRDAVCAGAAAVGFWTRGEDGGYEMDPQRAEAIREGLGGAEQEWRQFYRDSIVSGDTRFAVVEGRLSADELTLTLKNTGKDVPDRLAGPLDLSVLARAR